MSGSLEIALVAGHAAGLVLLPPLFVALVRARARRALAGGVEPSAVHFTSIQWLSNVPAAVLLALVASIGTPLADHLMSVLRGIAGAFAPLLLLPFVLLPFAGALLAATLVGHEITEAARATDLTRSESLRQAAVLLVALAAPLAGLLGMQVAMALGALWPGVVTLLAGVAAGAAVHARWARQLGLDPHAVTHGPLRDRLVALAARAGVTLQQLYVMPMRRSRMANAFAVHGGVVLLTDWLLEHLDRREVDGVLAHELAHIRLGHPRWLGIVGAAAAVAGAIAGIFAGFAGAVVGAVVLSVLATRFASRRCEYEADALAVRLTGDPEALVTGLVRITRLNHVPLQWSRLAERGLTHPSTLRRAGAIARAAGIPAERLRELLASDAPPRDLDAVPAPAAPGGKLFSSGFKRGTSARLAWLLLLATVALSVAAVGVVRVLDLPRALAPVAGTLAAFAALTLVTDLLAARGIAGLRDALARRLAAPADARFVGLSPGAGTRVYENFFDWDVGFVTLGRDALVYRGEETSFTLPRDAIVDVRLAGGPPGWIPTPRAEIEWLDPATGTGDVLQFRPADSSRLVDQARASAALVAGLEAWRDGAAATDRPSSAPPREDEVTGLPFARALHPSTLVPLVVLATLGTGLLAGVLRLPFWPGSGPGAFDAWAGAVGALVLVRIPGWRAREPRRAPAAATRRAA